jgi:all-trans-retinol 13,14-reductase
MLFLSLQLQHCIIYPRRSLLFLQWQHYIAGGATHAFEEHGYEFDTGIHYIGNIEKRRKYLDLITDTPLEWDKMGRLSADNDGDECYDELEIG